MPRIDEDDTLVQVIQFEVTAEKQQALVNAIAAETERWVRRLPGFVSSALHASEDGRRVLNYAQWRSREAFEAFVHHPEGERLRAAIAAVGPEGKPLAVAYRVARSIEAA